MLMSLRVAGKRLLATILSLVVLAAASGFVPAAPTGGEGQGQAGQADLVAVAGTPCTPEIGFPAASFLEEERQPGRQYLFCCSQAYRGPPSAV